MKAPRRTVLLAGAIVFVLIVLISTLMRESSRMQERSMPVSGGPSASGRSVPNRERTRSRSEGLAPAGTHALKVPRTVVPS